LFWLIEILQLRLFSSQVFNSWYFCCEFIFLRIENPISKLGNGARAFFPMTRMIIKRYGLIPLIYNYPPPRPERVIIQKLFPAPIWKSSSSEVHPLANHAISRSVFHLQEQLKDQVNCSVVFQHLEVWWEFAPLRTTCKRRGWVYRESLSKPWRRSHLTYGFASWLEFTLSLRHAYGQSKIQRTWDLFQWEIFWSKKIQLAHGLWWLRLGGADFRPSSLRNLLQHRGMKTASFSMLRWGIRNKWSIWPSKGDFDTLTSSIKLTYYPRWVLKVITGLLLPLQRRDHYAWKIGIGLYCSQFGRARWRGYDLEDLDWCVWGIEHQITISLYRIPFHSWATMRALERFRISCKGHFSSTMSRPMKRSYSAIYYQKYIEPGGIQGTLINGDGKFVVHWF